MGALSPDNYSFLHGLPTGCCQITFWYHRRTEDNSWHDSVQCSLGSPCPDCQVERSRRNRLLNMETAAVKNVEMVKEREVKLRALMKEVSKKENELDKLQAALEKAEKKIKEVDHSLYVAKEEAHHLQANIHIKEEDVKINEQNYSPRAATLVKEAARSVLFFLRRKMIFYCFTFNFLQSG